MIGYLEGKLLKIESDRIILLANQVGYEVLLPAFIMASVRLKTVGSEIALHVFYYQTERQPKPVLIGFNLEAEKEFFQRFISVEAIGPMKAVRALSIPVREIARAIESKDTGKLEQLQGIGKRTARKIIATLEGKVDKFVLIRKEEAAGQAPVIDFSKQVLDVLVGQLGHKTVDARRMINAALKRNRGISSPEELFDEVYRGEL